MRDMSEIFVAHQHILQLINPLYAQNIQNAFYD